MTKGDNNEKDNNIDSHYISSLHRFFICRANNYHYVYDSRKYGTPIPPLSTSDFVPNGTTGAITGSLANNTLSFGNNNLNSSGSYFYGGDSDVAYCVAGV